MGKKPITCRKIDDLIKDEKMANKEYAEYASKAKDRIDKHNFKKMSNDELGHKEILEGMKKDLCKK